MPHVHASYACDYMRKWSIYWLYEKTEHILLLVHENNTSLVSQCYYYIMCHIVYIRTHKVIIFKKTINYKACVPHLLWSPRKVIASTSIILILYKKKLSKKNSYQIIYNSNFI